MFIMDFLWAHLELKGFLLWLAKIQRGALWIMKYSDVKEKFNDNASQYDSQRKKLIPWFDDFYATAVSVAETKNIRPNILDIGAGTGLLSAFIFEK